ncbi:MAG TPA: hypothetical protein VG226_01200 [Acidimicrobiales bacterium]|nr:hypothetical protein [Acidimicrobiales bacterium]
MPRSLRYRTASWLSSAGLWFRRRRARSLGTGALATTAMAIGLSACQLSPPEVILYGDSMSVPNQAGTYFDYFVTVNGQAQVVNNVFPGTTPCTWSQQMQSDASSGLMSVAVLEFVGSNDGCDDYPYESPAYYQAYQQQVTTIAQTFSSAGVHTFLIGYPVPYSAVQTADANWDHLNEIYAQVAANVPNTTFVNAGASVEDGGQFAWTLPCLSFEPYCAPGGQNPVRAADGFHFCPLSTTVPACGDYTSGGLRFGMAEASAVSQFLSTGSAPNYEGPPLPPSGTAPTLAPGQASPYVGVNDVLNAGSSLGIGGTLHSLDGRYSAVLQEDGNFVVYGPSGPVWATNTTGMGATTVAMQTSGNLVLSAGSQSVWSSGTSGTGSDAVALQNNGSLLVYGPQEPYGPAGPAWSSTQGG